MYKRQDMKYGDKRINAFYKENYHVTSQLLHAHHVIFPDGRYIEAALPDIWSLSLIHIWYYHEGAYGKAW